MRHERPPYSQEAIDAALEGARRFRPDAVPSDYYIPDQQPALTSIAVDGHGHLWVFPWMYPAARRGTDPPERRPVDVYAAGGERLFSGWIKGDMTYGWPRARGDHVYVQEFHPHSGEIIIVRYRLLEPFQ